MQNLTLTRKASDYLRREVPDVLNAAMNAASTVGGSAETLTLTFLVTLEYTDGTREAGKVSAARWAEICSEPFAIVSEIQAQRVPQINPRPTAQAQTT